MADLTPSRRAEEIVDHCSHQVACDRPDHACLVCITKALTLHAQEVEARVWEKAAQDCILAIRDTDPTMIKQMCLGLSDLFRRRAQEPEGGR